MRIAINGFGRIGRTVFRQIVTSRAHDDIEVVAINDIAPPETCAYLLKYDSAFGPFPGDVALDGSTLVVGQRRVPITTQPDLGALNLPGTDLILECTGKVKTRARAESFRNTGARKLLISGPSAAADVTAVLGVNETAATGTEIVSNASCTTNALAPLLKELDASQGILSGHMTTVHVYTGSQPLVDAPRGETLVRSRAGAASMIPTTTSAASLLGDILPDIAGRITAASVRVPCLSVSAIDLTVTLAEPPGDLQDTLRMIAAQSPVIGATEDPCVSTDMKARPESLIIALPESLQTGAQARIFGWYDNEWGFSARMIDMARLMSTR